MLGWFLFFLFQYWCRQLTCSVIWVCRIDKPKALSLLLHTADISHPAKAWDLHHRWTMSLLEEFFRQVAWEFTKLFCSFADRMRDGVGGLGMGEGE